MSDTEATPTTTAAPAPEGNSDALDNAIRQVFGDEAAEAVGAKPLVKPEEKKPVDEEKKPSDTRASKRILAAQQAELRQAKVRRELETKRAEISQRESALKELTALAEQAKQARTSPSKLLELAGLKPKDFLEALATEHEPEAVARRVAEETKGETQKLREELEAVKREAQLKEERAKLAEIDRVWEGEQRAFIEMVASNPEELPNLQGLTERRIVLLANEVLNRVVGKDENGRPITENEAFFAETGKYPTNEEIARYIEHKLAEEAAETLSARRARTGQGTPKPSGMTGESKPTPTDSRGHSPRTLTARVATSRAASQKKPEDMSQQELDELSQAIWDQAAAKRRSG